MRVSVVVPTYNSEGTIETCLRSVFNQSYDDVEVIVIDRFSEDRTVDIAERFGAKVYQLECERAKAKNFGLRKSRGKYVLFIDSDMELTENVVYECVELAESDERIGGVVIPERSCGRGFLAKVRDFERSFYSGTYVESARFFRRDIALSAGGFDENIVFFEEATLPKKVEMLGYDVRKRIRSFIIHHENSSIIEWLIKKYYYGKSARLYINKYGGDHINTVKRLKIFLTNRRFYMNPLMSSAMLFLKCLEFLAVIMGIVTN